MTIDTDNKTTPAVIPVPDSPDATNSFVNPKDWDQIMLEYKGSIQTIDLRSLDAAQSIAAVSRELGYIHPKAGFLFVLRNHLPVLFLDKLTEDKFDYHLKVIAPGEVYTLIFKH